MNLYVSKTGASVDMMQVVSCISYNQIMTVSFGSKGSFTFLFKYIYIYIYILVWKKIELFSKYDFLFGYPDDSGTNGGNWEI